MTIKSIDLPAILRQSRVFACLNETQRRELAGKARVEHYTDRTLLALRGEIPGVIKASW